MILYAIFAFDKYTQFPGINALIPTIGSALIILYATPHTYVGKILGNNALVGIGLISYSAYLWHQPLFAFTKYKSIDEPSELLLGVLAIASIVLAYFSWQYIEKPFRNKKSFSRKQIFIYSFVGSVFFIFIGLVGHFNKGFENRFSKDQLHILSFEKYDYKDSYKFQSCFLDSNQSYSAFPENCVANNEHDTMIWGDSHAAALTYGLKQKFGDVTQYTASGCPPIKDGIFSRQPNCKLINDFVLKEIDRLKPKQIFLHANWNSDEYKNQNPLINLSKTIQYIKNLSPSSLIYIVGPVPQWHVSLPKLIVKQGNVLSSELFLKNSTLNKLYTVDESLRNFATRENVTFLSALDVLCTNGGCLASTNYNGEFTLVTWDYGHLTEAGSVFLAKKLLTK